MLPGSSNCNKVNLTSSQYFDQYFDYVDIFIDIVRGWRLSRYLLKAFKIFCSFKFHLILCVVFIYEIH